MYQHDSTPDTPDTPDTPGAPEQAAAPSNQEFYFPRGVGTDPDFYLPVDRENMPARLSRWIHGLPGFGRRRS